MGYWQDSQGSPVWERMSGLRSEPQIWGAMDFRAQTEVEESNIKVLRQKQDLPCSKDPKKTNLAGSKWVRRGIREVGQAKWGSDWNTLDRGFRFGSMHSERPLAGFKQETDVIWFVSKSAYSEELKLQYLIPLVKVQIFCSVKPT